MTAAFGNGARTGTGVRYIEGGWRSFPGPVEQFRFNYQEMRGIYRLIQMIMAELTDGISSKRSSKAPILTIGA